MVNIRMVKRANIITDLYLELLWRTFRIFTAVQVVDMALMVYGSTVRLRNYVLIAPA